MSDFLKGNFTPKYPVTGTPTTAEDGGLEARFEREALKRLGGSVAFVAKKKVMWDAEPKAPAKPAAEAPRETAVTQAKTDQ
jgi:hypothetical protein